jgi:hypothetical protein
MFVKPLLRIPADWDLLRQDGSLVALAEPEYAPPRAHPPLSGLAPMMPTPIVVRCVMSFWSGTVPHSSELASADGAGKRTLWHIWTPRAHPRLSPWLGPATAFSRVSILSVLIPSFRIR